MLSLHPVGWHSVFACPGSDHQRQDDITVLAQHLCSEARGIGVYARLLGGGDAKVYKQRKDTAQAFRHVVMSFLDNRLGPGAASHSAAPDYFNWTVSGATHCNDSGHYRSGYPDTPSAKTCPYERSNTCITNIGLHHML